MGKKVKDRSATPADLNPNPNPAQPLRVKYGPDWEDCKKKYKKAGTWPRIFKQFEKFITAKEANPTAMFGANDKPATHGYKGFYKAHLTHDDSIIYRYSKDENLIRVYGIWSHDELGTGDPPNFGRIYTMADRLNSQVFENRPKSI